MISLVGDRVMSASVEHTQVCGMAEYDPHTAHYAESFENIADDRVRIERQDVVNETSRGDTVHDAASVPEDGHAFLREPVDCVILDFRDRFYPVFNLIPEDVRPYLPEEVDFPPEADALLSEDVSLFQRPISAAIAELKVVFGIENDVQLIFPSLDLTLAEDSIYLRVSSSTSPCRQCLLSS